MAPPMKRSGVDAVAATKKAAKVTKAEPTERDEFPWCVPAFDLIAEMSDDIETSSASMFKAAIPLALLTPKDARHKYQMSIIDSMDGLATTTAKARDDAVSAIEGNIRTHKEEMQTADENLTKSTEVLAEKVASKDSAIIAEREANTKLASVQEAVGAEKQKVIDAESEVARLAAFKEEFEKDVAESTPPLKNGNFAPKDWRARQKAINHVVELLAKVGAPESLKAGVAVAFKERPEARSEFANFTVDSSEAALQEHITKTAADIETSRGVKDAQAGPIEDAEKILTQVQTEADAVTQARMDAENAWVDADSVVLHIKENISRAPEHEKELTKQLQEAMASRERLMAAITLFHELKDRAHASAPDAVPEAVPGAVPDANEMAVDEVEKPVEESATQEMAGGNEASQTCNMEAQAEAAAELIVA